MACIMTSLLSIPKKSLFQVWTEVQKPGDCWRLLGQVCLPDPTSHIFWAEFNFCLFNSLFLSWNLCFVMTSDVFFWPLRSNLTLWKTWWTSHFFQRQLQFCCSNHTTSVCKLMLSLSQLATSAWACWFSGMASGFRLLPSGKSSPWLAGEIHRLYNGGLNGKVIGKIWEHIPTQH